LIPQSPQQELENLHSTKPPFVPDLEEKETRKKTSKQSTPRRAVSTHLFTTRKK
jgi:hypothetical protein